MARMSGRVWAVVTAIAVGSVALVAPGAVADGPGTSPTTTIAVDDLAVATDGGTVIAAAPGGTVVPAPAEVADAPRSDVARAHVERTVRSLQLDVTDESLRTAPTRSSTADAPVRFIQWLDGLPVYGSSVVVGLTTDGGMTSMLAATAEPAALPSSGVSPAQAQRIARTHVAADESDPLDAYAASTPYALAYAPELLGEAGAPTRAWRTFVTPTSGIGGHEVIVDAVDGDVLLSVERLQRAQRGICDGANTYTGDSSYGWCGQTGGFLNVPYVRAEGDPAAGIAEADAAYEALGDTTTFFANALGVDINALVAPTDASIGRGTGSTRTLAGVVRYCDPVEAFFGDDELAQIFCPMPNAYWYADESQWNPATEPYPGGQMFIGEGFARAVDVVAHEVSHGVTSATSNLIYQGEPGAINESMSDIFGQLVQLYADGSGDPGWDLGEDVATPAHFPLDAFNGPIRSMSVPGDFGQPSKMTDPLWDLDPYDEDAGGVHTNSGVGNYAAYLMAHGGSVNGVSVTALDSVNGPNSQAGVTKLGRLYWKTQQLLPSNANYRVLGLTLAAACTQLIGTNGFTADDCSGSVAKAIAATGMTKLTPIFTASVSSVIYKGSVALTGQVKDARGAAVPGASVRLDKQLAGTSTWSPVQTLTTSSTGKAGWSVVPTRTTSYRMVIVTGGTTAITGARKVTVAPTVTRTASASAIRLKQSFTVTGRVTPGRPGQSVRLERYAGGTWKPVRSAVLTSTSTYRITLTPSVRTTTTYRIYRPAEVAYAAASSTTFKVTVR